MDQHQLFKPYQMGSITLQNRVVMAPMTRSRSLKDNVATDLMVQYYHQRAEAGLIITEGVSPSPNGLGYPRIAGIFNQEQVDSWKKVTDAVHEKGAKIFIQIMHTGRVSTKHNMPEGARVLAPSALQLEGETYTDQAGMQPYDTPEEMTKADIEAAIEEFVTAAKLSIEAGFDGVELHAANGYLLEQFLNPASNQRTDEYGGSAANRNRFVIEVAQKVVAAIGADKVGMRISPYGVFNGVAPFDGIDEQYLALIDALNDLDITYIHIVDHSAMGAPEVPEQIKTAIRKAFKNTYILSGGYDKERAKKDIDDSKGDIVAFGRAFISNPDLVTRMQKDADLTPPDMDTFYAPTVEGYVDYPTLEEQKA